MLINIPEVFELETKDEIAYRRRAALESSSESGKHSKLMFIIGEVKDISSARFGHKIIIKHLPDFPIHLNKDRHQSLCKQFETEMGLWSDNDSGRLIVIGTFGINNSGTASFEGIALMMVTGNWIPYENADELLLINTLIQARQRFIKYLRYNVPSTTPSASVLLADKDKATTAIFVCPTNANEGLKEEMQGLMYNCGIKGYLWSDGKKALPL